SMQPLGSSSKIERLLIVRLSAMGDIIHTLPAAGVLRKAFPDAMIGWVVEERWAELLCTLPTARSGLRSPQRPLADKVHTVNLKSWRRSLFSPQTWEQIGAALSELKGANYQVAVDFQGAARSALIAHWSGAPTIYGAMQPRENIASMFYTRQVITQGEHIVEQNVSLAEAAIEKTFFTPPIELPHDESAEKQCEEKLAHLGGSNFAILNPGAGWGAKQWPAERYGAVAKKLAEDGLKSLINFGPGEQELAHQVEIASHGAAQSISCSLTQLIALTRRAKLFIGGDTGPLHLAASLHIPVVGIYGPTNPARNGPFGTRSIVLRSESSITSHKRHRATEEGLLEITADQVVTAARELLRGPRG
ncbi:MAG TPA: glycosyltransferase family 9 protein, partial [Terriglobales bacterium]|nr:glycosyltransferase family 9 protein [Terriglobales bacterium]